MRKQENFNIDGHDVEIFQLPVPISLKVLTRLSKILAKPIGSAISGDEIKDQNILDKNINLGNILGNLGDRLDEEIVITTIEMILPYISIKQKIPRNLESFDEYGVIFLLKVVYKALEVNYADFLDVFRGKGKDEKIETLKA